MRLEENNRKSIRTREAEVLAKKLNEITGLNLFRNTRKREIIEARSMLNWYLKSIKHFTLHEIRDFYRANGKPYDHSTVLHSLRMFDVYKMYVKEYDHWMAELNLQDESDDSVRTIIMHNLSTLDTDALRIIQRQVIELKHECMARMEEETNVQEEEVL